MTGETARELDARNIAPARPAATVVVMRPGPDGPEVLLTQRPATMAFGPGLHVFPGGRLDPQDSDPRLLERLRRSGAEPSSHAGACMVAAIRELYEEAGVLLGSPRGSAGSAPLGTPATLRARRSFLEAIVGSDLELRGDWLVPLSRWVTPPVMARRFDARFFVTELPPAAALDFDPGEVAGHAWMTPRTALGAMADGRIALWPPTSTTLQQLAPAAGIADVWRYLTPSPADGSDNPAAAVSLAPRVDWPAPSVGRVRTHGAGAIGGQTVNTYLVGERRVAVIDPGDPSEAAIDLLLRLVEERGGRISAVLLTAPVPDHAAGIESLALQLSVPILAGAGARVLLASTLEPVDDGAILDVADIPIRVHATPGTHPDHLAFELPTADAVLVGDLEGPGPARAIPEAVDERLVRRSRDAVRRLDRASHLAAHD
jgi:8-oxo-dGTP pyrophosphatase MutT (NUDIX family)/glyoxylase-like metal-dependent hydrolase (beta-lactamase superfamily II)